MRAHLAHDAECDYAPCVLLYPQAILEQNKLVELLEASSSEMKKTLDVATETTAAEAKQKDALFERLILAVRSAAPTRITLYLRLTRTHTHTQQEEQAASLRMALHAAEKEIVTMTAVVDGVLKLHPSTFKQISEEQDFNSRCWTCYRSGCPSTLTLFCVVCQWLP